MVRGTEAARLCGIAVDHGTRVLSINDPIDTADENWEEDVISACRDHVGHNAHTSKRIKFKLMNRFKKYGGAIPREVYGYHVPDDAKTYDDWQKDPEATPIIREAMRRLRETLNCSSVADWLNSQGIPVGPYCRRENWDGSMVRRFFTNPVLKGMPGRGFKHTIKHHETGRRIAVKNPNGPVYREFPHLAHVDADEFDALKAALEASNARYKRTPLAGDDPLLYRPRKRTAFPGQHARCWYCGRQFTWGGNGMAGNLMCAGARESRCWNSLGFSGEMARLQVVNAITERLCRIDGFENQFVEMIKGASNDLVRIVAAMGRSSANEERLKAEQQNLKTR